MATLMAPLALLESLRPHIRRMQGYTPGEQRNSASIIKLNTNECPYPPSPVVLEAVRDALTGDRLRKYPEPMADSFRRAASTRFNIDPDMILCGNGSDDLLTILTRAFVPNTRPIATPTPSYPLYRTLSEIQGATCLTVPFMSDWQLPSPWPLPDASLTFLPNPNSPSGTQVSESAVRALAAQLRGPLILDEAYADFASWNGLHLVGDVSNVIVTRSCSKFFALAGMRFGFLVAPAPVVHELSKVKDSYNCDVLSIVAATAAIGDVNYYESIRKKILATRKRLAVSLEKLGFQVTPSQANFVWCIRDDRPVEPIYQALRERNILIRYMRYPTLEGLRFTVGTNAEIDILLGALTDILSH